MINIILKGEPRSTNNIYKTMCRGNFPMRYMTPDGKALKEDYCWQIISQYKEKKLITEDVEVHIKLYFGNKRKNDIDNFNKILLDSMTGLVWLDDSQIKKMTLEKLLDTENPRIEVTVQLLN